MLTAPPPAAAPAAPEPEDEGIESRIELRPIDRAAVRVFAVSGVRPVAFDGWGTDLARVAAIARASHGTGVGVGSRGLVLTAAHVVQGADFVAVLPTGTNDPIPAEVVYVDLAHDVAFVHLATPLADTIELPRAAPRMRVGQPLYGTGFPIDVRERYPAAVFGELSRENNDGSLQVDMTVNPGNSGGPVIDAEGRLLGIICRRGEPRAGVVGIAYIEPLRFILPAYEHARAALDRSTPTYDQDDAILARVAADFVRTSDDRPLYEQTSMPTLQQAAAVTPSPEASMMVASHAWNMSLALLEAREASTLADLPEADRRNAEWLVRTAVDLARLALDQAPYLRVRYSAVRAILVHGQRALAHGTAAQQPAQPAQAAR
jgi:hypothetical protein